MQFFCSFFCYPNLSISCVCISQLLMWNFSCALIFWLWLADNSLSYTLVVDVVDYFEFTLRRESEKLQNLNECFVGCAEVSFYDFDAKKSGCDNTKKKRLEHVITKFSERALLLWKFYGHWQFVVYKIL